MTRIFPIRSDAPVEDPAPRVIRIDDDTADEVIDALGSQTVRDLLGAIYREPRPASELASALDTSIQNVRYHLDNLADADLVTVTGTWYSDRGHEMDVYAPTHGALVLFEGELDSGTSIREALGRLASGVGILGLAAVVLDGLVATGPPGDSGDVPSGNGQETVTTVLTTTAPDTRTTTTTTPPQAPLGPGQGVFEAVAGMMSPGLAFFLGGTLVLVLGFLWWYRTRHRSVVAG